MKSPLVSVIVPTRDRPALLRRAIDSILQQTLTSVEVIVAEDGSGHEHRKAYEQMQSTLPSRVRFLLTAAGECGRYGPAENRNRGIRAARGAFVAFLDDDDYWVTSDHLELSVRMLERENADFLFGNWRNESRGKIEVENWHAHSRIAITGKVVENSPTVLNVSHDVFFRAMVRGFLTHLNTCVIRKTVLAANGEFFSPIHYGEDQHLTARVAEQSRKILYRPEAIAVLDVTPRPRAFSAYTETDKNLLFAMATQHLHMHAHSPALRAAAKALESWSYVCAAQPLLQEGQIAAAAACAWQAVLARPGKSALQILVRCLLARLFGAARSYDLSRSKRSEPSSSEPVASERAA